MHGYRRRTSLRQVSLFLFFTWVISMTACFVYRRCGVILNHTVANKAGRSDCPSTTLFNLQSRAYDHERLLKILPSLEARAFTCHSIVGTAESSIEDHIRLDAQPMTIEAVELTKPVSDPPRTVAQVVTIVSDPVHDFNGTLLDLHNILCEPGVWGHPNHGPIASRRDPRFTFEELTAILVQGFHVDPGAVFTGFPDEPDSFKNEYIRAYSYDPSIPRSTNHNLSNRWRSGFTRRLIFSLVGVCWGYEDCGCLFRLDSLPSCRSSGVQLDHMDPTIKTKGPSILFEQKVLPTDIALMDEVCSLQPLCRCCHKLGAQ